MKNATRTLIAVLAFLSIHGSVTSQGVIAAEVDHTDVGTYGSEAHVTGTTNPVTSYPASWFESTASSQDETADEPTAIVAFGASPETQDRLDWAAGRFAAAGLELPYVEVHFFDSRESCDGYDGAFRQSQTPLRIDICNPNKLIIIHELAHAWDKHDLDSDARGAFMELRGLESWNSPTALWKQRGVEDLADVVVWGLMEYASGFGAAAASKLAAFELVTGVAPPRDGSGSEAAVTAEPAVHDYS